ncbi:MAG: recombinase family protein [Candidatus Saccharibacteria bacterium]
MTDTRNTPALAGGPKRAVLYLRVSTARQATQGGEAEGYSIPAQRAACQRKAQDLGATVVDEYIDAGQSARSADRPALQDLLNRLMDAHDVDYVIVHKVDRLARDRADDVAIGLTIHKAGAGTSFGIRADRRDTGRNAAARHHGRDRRVLLEEPLH